MSFPPQRQSSNASHQLDRQNDQSSTSQSTNPGQSPLDWSTYMNFTTPPVTNAGPASNGLRSAGGSYGNVGGDQFKSFAQGIAVSRPSPSNLDFQHPYQQQGQQQQQRYGNGPMQGQSQQMPSHSMSSPRLSSSNGQPLNKGKSPATAEQNSADNAGDDGLSLDPTAFSRDIRFQVPNFLSGQMVGAPTFPPGGEAWSGFAGANFFGNDSGAGSNTLTPGQLFNQMFNISGNGQESGGSGDAGAGPSYSGGSQNVSDALNGFMGGDQSWEWNADDHHRSDSTTQNFGQPYYVNPNPSQNVLGRQQGGPPRQPDQNTVPSPRQRPSVPSLDMRPAAAGMSSAPGSATQPSSSTQQPRTAPPRDNSLGGYGQPPQPSKQTSLPARNPGSTSMPTSALLPQAPYAPAAYTAVSSFPNVPSLSTSTAFSKTPASTVNIASSSTAPYAPPSNTASLLTAPTAPPFMGPSLAEGPGLYSTTGFDMVGVLARVANRKDPKTVLGPVDLSCSFAVVDIRRYDNPIVYASPTFIALTGYDLPQVLGRNCRFLQSPDGEVVKGSKRKYTDNVAVAHLKRMLNAGKECQASLINYRRGGVPFINLVTVVPIPWDGTDIVYHVGFQVDLVDQPNAILRNMRDGSYQVNYTVANPPQPPLRAAGRDPGISGLSADILDIMGSKVNAAAFAQGEDGPKQEWLKMVLEHCDDFVHVLSLKGLFQYVSPSVRRVLEYEPEDLLNKNISDICHPSDIVPLMRELKDSTHAPNDGQSARTVNLVFRIRRKNTGYIWIESTGRLHVEPGKGRKAVILSGRARSVPVLHWEAIGKNGGLAETEFWAKVSYEGLILHVTSSVGEVLGQPADDVLGQSFFSLLPGGDNGPPTTVLVDSDPSSPVAQVASAFRSATSSDCKKAVPVHHRMVQKSGQQIDVITIFYPPRSTAEMPSRSDSDASSPTSDSSRPASTSSAGIGGIKATSLVVQIKLLPANWQSQGSIAAATNARPLANGNSTNLFEELETTRGTSWQYELHQLRVTNRRLRDQIETAKKSGLKTKGKKRKVEGGAPVNGGAAGASGGGDSLATAGQQSSAQAQSHLPEQFNAAPRHQLAPGFGLVPPGMQSTYYS